jgi:hypothetical protein
VTSTNPDGRARATAVSPEDREFAALRRLLYALRPDQADPLQKPPPPATSVQAVRTRDPRDGWGGTPPGLDLPEVVADTSIAAVVEVMARLRALPSDARAVCTWLRLHAVLTTARSLYVDVGMAFAGAVQLECWGRDLTARRDGAHAHGRRLVAEAARAWGLPIV